MSGNATAAKDAFIRSMRTFDAIQDYAKRVNDIEIKMLCGIVADYGSMIPDLVSRIGREAVRDIADAEVILTTAHRSKGLEFEQVVLNDDFKTLVDDRGAMLTALKELELGQEVHLLYVALTRATNAVQWNSSLRDAVTAVQESRLPIPTPKPATISAAVAAIDGMAPKVERAFFESKASVMAHKVEGSTGRLFGAKPTISSAVLKTSSGVAASGFRRGQPLTSAAVLQPETTP